MPPSYPEIALITPACIGCASILHRPTVPLPLCARCQAESPPFTADERIVRGVEALLPWTGPAARAYAAYKLEGCLDLLGGLARALAGAPALRRRPAYDLVTWVPAYALRTLARGFDPAAELVRAAARLSGHGRRSVGTLRRASLVGPRQRGQSAARRRRAPFGTFDVVPRRRPRIVGATILLCDDVVTTGATLSAARACLLDAGAARVDRLALFRADL